MNVSEWLIFILIMQIIHGVSTWKLYEKAGRKAVESFVPIYNLIILMKIINRPIWWVLLLFIPIINLLMIPVVWVETVKSFGKDSRQDTILVLLTFGFYITFLNYNSPEKLVYSSNRDLQPKTKTEDTISSLVFAIIVATLVHTYVIQPFTIPSSSLEKTLLIGDFLFVSKINYGARTPMTSVAMPMVHDSIPLTGVKSYLFSDDVTKKETSWLNKLQLPYFRFPAIEKIKRNEIVVFNQPADTLRNMDDFHPDRNYYKPIDKKTNLVKRCVGMPGDSLEIKDGYIYINNKISKLPPSAKAQYNFFIDTQGQAISQDALVNIYGAREGLRYENGNFALTDKGQYFLTLTDEEAALIARNPVVKNVKKNLEPKGQYEDAFPHVSSLKWNIDNFGPIYIPQKGKTVKLDVNTLPFYKRIIEEYEHNSLKVHGSEIIINGKPTNHYTFKQDYYWMMGDNRQNSLDARFWGYVPFDHVIGKPVFIWFSWNKDAKGINKIRWNRIFSVVGEGEPKSYLIHFLVVLGLFVIGNKIVKNRKKTM
ncbi:signal peptidase I [Flavobacterium nitrogenifigens]|uniref:Signal peptidase I n=2 Tax=Flavobacterium TaxID=237 RepID=A0A7W7IYG9_9FLAO|nr:MULTISPECIES: signal peptidase I [Flavobacterium]MBB4802618.1 signal peptidase I [Flavobacterium nitrogenifigens]MBB6387576.1 signal peptidase I [Flavobacterium notoginsengisoli]